ncbi:MAG: hypothetical protein K8H90_01835, partial [Thermoanaerobaculia bacterium]|nr:hypothetical protein [Thermoanaerobaculia bacterium]
MPVVSPLRSLSPADRRAVLALLLLAAAPLAAQPPDLRVQRLTPDGEVFSDLYVEGIGPPSISPDGRWVAYWYDGDVDDVFDLYVASRFGGDVRRISAPRPPGSDGPDSNTFRFTPDSRRVVFRIDQEDANRTELWSVPVDGEAADAVKVSGDLAPGAEVASDQVTPDSAWVVFGVGTASDYGLWSAPIDASAAPVRLHPAGSDDSNGISTRLAGSTVVFNFSGAAGQPSQLWIVPADGSTPAVRVSGDLVPGGDVSSFSVTPDNARLVYRADARFNGVDELW